MLYKLFYAIFTQNNELANELFTVTMNPEDGPTLMIIYGVGVAAIFIVLVLMYRYALSKKEELDLSKKEIFDSKSSMYSNLVMATIPVISVIIAWLKIGGESLAFSLSGISYWLYGIAMPLYHKRRKVVRKNKFEL